MMSPRLGYYDVAPMGLLRSISHFSFNIMISFFLLIAISTSLHAQIPDPVRILMKFYPQIVKYDNNRVYCTNGESFMYDDGKKKSPQELLDNPDIEDMFTYKYQRGMLSAPIERYYDPGRIRHEGLFKAIYGKMKNEVSKNLTKVIWCPKTAPQMIRFSTVNDIHKRVMDISKELDEYPDWKKYVSNIGGTFNWRNIAGTNRISFHSFGITMDINTKHSHYWQWVCNCTDENKILTYHNAIPQGIVDIFEKHGFIWGGKWYHFDTMHFEFRPELVWG